MPPKRIFRIFWIAFILLAIVGSLVWLLYLRFRAYTNDAYVEGNQLIITPLKWGFVTGIYTDDTFLVKKGQLIIDLDQTDSLIAIDFAQNSLATQVREVCQAFHQVFVYLAEIETRIAELIKTTQDYQHRVEVLEAAAVSLEEFQHAVAALRAGYFSLKSTEAYYERALALVQGTSITNHPLVQASASQLRNAWVQLYRCKIYAPVEGLVAQRSAQVGMWVDKGEPLLSIIPLDQIWVNANFKETQMRRMRIGQEVSLTSDLYGRGVRFQGTILGLPGGAGNAFSLLPPQNLSGNWIKIVQRLPVRVGLVPEEIEKHPLRIGLSMEATANLRDQEGKLVPTTTEGSPTYTTSIFDLEEVGSSELIDAIIAENLDPTLIRFAYSEISLERSTIGEEVRRYLVEAGVPIE